MHSTRTPIKPAPVNANVSTCVTTNLKTYVVWISLASVGFIVALEMASSALYLVCPFGSPYEPLSIPCWVAIWAPPVLSAMVGCFLGWRFGFIGIVCSVLVVGLSLLLLFYGTSTLSPWHGTDHLRALRLAVLFCVLPTVLSALVGALIYRVSPKHRANKGFNRTPESSGPAKPGESSGGAG